MVNKDGEMPPSGTDRWVCPVVGCAIWYTRCDNRKRHHFDKKHPDFQWNIKLPVAALLSELQSNPGLAPSLGSLYPSVTAEASSSNPTSTTDNMASVELSSGRGQREKKPTEKAKDTSAKKEEPVSDQLVPPKYKLPDYDPKWLELPKEIPKNFDHTKINEQTGETFDFYKLGPQ